MSRNLRAQVALVLAGLAVGSSLYLARIVKASDRIQDAAAPLLIAQPATWQPFTATVTESSPLFKGLELFGDFARSSDGSERYDQATSDKRLHYVTIRNVKSGWQYACDMVQSVCERSPLPKQPIVLVRVNTPYLAATSERLEGYELDRYTPPTGEVLAPRSGTEFCESGKGRST